MEYLTKDLSAFPLISFFIGAVVLFVFLRAIARVLPLLIKRKSFKATFNRNFTIVELLVWMSLILWLIPHYLSVNFAYGIVFSIILLIAILILGWYALRDIIAGFILRSNIGFRKDAQIKIGDIEGMILDFYTRNFRIIDEKGDKVLVPYSAIIGKSVKFYTYDKTMLSKHVSLQFVSALDYVTIEKKLKYAILTHPKALINTVPKVNIVSHVDNNIELDVKYSARDSKGLDEIEHYLNDFTREL